MSLEAAIAELTKAVNANTAAIQADKPASTSKPPKADKPAATGPKHDRSEVNAAVNEVKESLGIEAAKALLKDNGYAKLADVEEKDFDKLYDAAKAALAAEPEGGNDGL